MASWTPARPGLRPDSPPPERPPDVIDLTAETEPPPLEPRPGVVAIELRDEFREDFWRVFEAMLTEVRAPIGLWAEQDHSPEVLFWASPLDFDGPETVFRIKDHEKITVLSELLKTEYVTFGSPETRSRPLDLRIITGDRSPSSITKVAFEFRDAPNLSRLTMLTWDAEGRYLRPIHDPALSVPLSADKFANYLARDSPFGEFEEIAIVSLPIVSRALLGIRDVAAEVSPQAWFRVTGEDLFLVYDPDPQREGRSFLIGGIDTPSGPRAPRRIFDSKPFEVRALVHAMEPLHAVARVRDIVVQIALFSDTSSWTILYDGEWFDINIIGA